MNTPKVKVSTRLSIGFGLVLLMMTIMVVIALSRFASIAEINTRIIEKDWAKADAANTIDAATRANARNTLELLIATDKAQTGKIYERIEANKKSVDEATETLEKLVYKPEGKELLTRIKEGRAKYVASFTKVSKLVDENKRDEAISLMTAETLPALDTLQQSIAPLAELQKQLLWAVVWRSNKTSTLRVY